MSFEVDVRFVEGTGAVFARAHFPDPVEGTARFDIDENGVATFAELDVPTGQANGSISKADFDALTNSINDAKAVVGKLPFITEVQ